MLQVCGPALNFGGGEVLGLTAVHSPSIIYACPSASTLTSQETMYFTTHPIQRHDIWD